MTNIKKPINIINLLFLICIVTGDICYTTFGGLWLKALTSIFFVALGVVNLIYAINNKTDYLKFSIILVAGLTFAMLGDIVLNIYFIGGAILFAIGHIFYFVAYCFISKFNPKDLIYSALIFVPSLFIILFVPVLNFGGILMQIVCVAYALIISLMLGKSIANFVAKKSFLTLIIMLGSILFFFSDVMLVFDVFASLPVVGTLCLATYYPAEFLLAYSILCANNSNKK